MFAGQRLQRAVSKDDLVLAGQGVELVGGGDEVLAGDLGHLFGHLDRQSPWRAVQARAHGGAAQGQLLQLRTGRVSSMLPWSFSSDDAPAGDLLRELDGGGVLQMGAAGLHDALVFLLQAAGRWRSARPWPGTACPQWRCTAAMCMAVGKVSLEDWDMFTWSLGWQQLLARRSRWPRLAMTSLAFMLDCVPLPVCHTTRGKWSFNLPAMTSSQAWQMAFSRVVVHLFGLDGVVGDGRRLLQNAESVGDLPGHDLAANDEILLAALGLCAPVAIRRHLHFTHGVAFNAVIHNFLSSRKSRLFPRSLRPGETLLAFALISPGSAG